jgi:hypothetical protein
MSNLVDVEFVRDFLDLADDSQDVQIDLLIPLYQHNITNSMDITDLSDEQLDDIRICICSAIGCHIQRSDPNFSSEIKSYKVGNMSKEFFKGGKQNASDWCELFELMKDDIDSKYGESGTGSVKRQGLSNEYDRPY